MADQYRRSGSTKEKGVKKSKGRSIKNGPKAVFFSALQILDFTRFAVPILRISGVFLSFCNVWPQI